MKHLSALLASCLLALTSSASPFAPEPSVEIVVYSDAHTASPLHIETIQTNAHLKPLRFDFPASYAGHRSVCRIPAAATNETLLVWSGGDAYAPGDPFAVLTPGDNLRTVLHRMSSITPRINLWSDAADRVVTTVDFNKVILAQRINNETNLNEFIDARLDISPPKAGEPTRIRVVRYAIDDVFCYTVGVGSEKDGYDQLVMMDKVFDPAGRQYLCEVDFLGKDMFDIDWDTLTGTDFRKGAVVDERGDVLRGGPKNAGLGVTNMTYLVVVGEGKKDFGFEYDTNTVRVLKTMVTRRFEKTRHAPVVDDTFETFYSARPTFTWSIPNEEEWAKKFGTSYTAFKVELHVYDASSTNLIWTSGTKRAPAQDYGGRFSWTGPDLSAVTTGYTSMLWRVSMYNAKFRSDAWSDFSVINIPTED